MLDYSEITQKKVILVNKEPYVVLDAHIFRMQQRKPQNKTKLKGLISGRVVEMTFHQSDKAEEAEIDKKDAKFLYTSRGEWWFQEPNDTSKRFKLDVEILGDGAKFIKPNTIIKTLIFDEKVFGIELPASVELKVTDAPPAVKGDTAKGGSKQITLETGATVDAPLFINEGDVVRINTVTGEYRERV